MPRLTFEEPLAGPPKKEPAGDERPEPKRDGVVVVLKLATGAIVVALVAAVVLLLTAGGEEPRAKTPDVPQISTTADDAAPTSTTPPAGIVAPEVHSETAVMSHAPTTTTPSPTGPPDRFVEVGKRCDTPGAYAFTKRYEPVVCADPGPKWRPMFR